MKNKKMLLIDGSGLAYRAFYALPELTTSTGVPANAVYGFVNMLLSVLEKEKPDYIASSFDKYAPTVRIEKFKDYKANRQKQPESLSAQFPLIEEYLNLLHIPVYFVKGYEADDCLATVAKQAAEKDIEVLILTGDLDFLQLVNDKIKVLMMRRGIKDLKLYDKEAVKERFDLTPDQIPDLKALSGDQSDNIPGVPGIGEKTAAKLLNEYGSVAELLKNTEKLPQKLKDRIENNKDILELCRELVVLNDKLDIKTDWDELENKSVYDSLPPAELIDWYKKLEFKSILSRMQSSASLEQREAADFTVVKNEKEIKECIEVIEKEKKCAVSIIYENNILALGLSAEKKNYFIDSRNISIEKIRGLVQKITECNIIKAFSNLKNFIKAFKLFDIKIDAQYFDVLIAEYLIDPDRTNTKLADASGKYFGEAIPGKKELLGSGKKARTIDMVPDFELAGYLAAQSEIVYKLRPVLVKKLPELSLEDLYYRVEVPLTQILARMEEEGVSLDVNYLKKLSGRFSKKIEEKEAEIFSLAGCEFNINSPKQVGEVLFEKMLIPSPGRTKTGYKTDAQTLRELSGSFPAAEKILEYRELAKLKSTYIDALPRLVDMSGKLHTNYNQTGTSTGRLSSRDPNLQNIPIKSEAGRQIRASFTAGSSGNVFVVADYSQIELRILAHLSGDDKLIKAFKDNLDIHTQTAAYIFGIAPEDVNESHRRKAKEINFGINYGMGEFGLSQRLGISRAEARNYIEGYFRTYPGVKKYIEATIRSAEKEGYVATIMGRRRIIKDITSRNATIKKQAERMAVNAPMQGSASDIIKIAMINLYKDIKEGKIPAKLLLQVHDELVLECNAKDSESVGLRVKEIMTDAVRMDVPVKVSIEAGKNWNELEDM
ncbi:MAG: DNA polymerase I [Armatimonadota bacterium]